MKTTSWLRVFSLTLLFHILITSSTSLSLSNDNKKESKREINAIERREPSNQKHLSEKEDSGEARWMSSYIFPIFPQFYNLDYNSVWNFLKRSDTIGYFVIRDIISVSHSYISFVRCNLCLVSLPKIYLIILLTIVFWIDDILGHDWYFDVGR